MIARVVWLTSALMASGVWAPPNQASLPKQTMELLESGAARPSQLSDLTAMVEFEPVQPDRSRGIELTVTITNSGQQSVAVLDPRDTTSATLETEEGWPVQPPVQVPRAFVNTAGRENEMPNQPTVLQLSPGKSAAVQIRVRDITGVLGRPLESQPGTGGRGVIPGDDTVQQLKCGR